MTAFVLLTLTISVLTGLGWLVSMLVNERPQGRPPRHAEDCWSVDGLPDRPYAA